MKIKFVTTEYRLAHGKEPRGRGGWAFEFPGSEEAWFAPASTYAEAKKAAQAEAERRFSFPTVEVYVKVLS